MEGFRYRVPAENEKSYPVIHNEKETKDFPIIPIGMLKIWRDELELDGDFLGL
jgi:hypothetical protein